MDGNPKQLIVERIKSATNILVTVSRDPSVDELAAALGFTLMLNKMDKHATAVFSGAIPPAISFLEPNKTFENTVDSLRDFIIALDKEKADRLRYKIEDDVVRIFITPYRTTITKDDLNFSQGDFNVELIIALGVEKKEDLDAAITAHGRILHDATVVTVNARTDKNSLGSVDWSEPGASSLCEMLMSLSEALQSGLLDQQIATSLLTGIVAATERFSNPHTSPKVMTMAAQLMAAGANQQLIAAKLSEGHVLDSPKPEPADGTTNLKEGSSQKLSDKKSTSESSDSKAIGEMNISHGEAVKEPAGDSPQSAVEMATELATEAEEDRADEELEHDKLEANMSSAVTPTLSVSDLQKDLEAATADVESAAAVPSAGSPSESTSEPHIGKAKVSDWRGKVIEPPSLGGTLSATSNDAEEENHEEDRSTRNHTILSHDGENAGMQSINATKKNDGEPPSVDPFADTLVYEETASTSKQRTIEPLAPSEPAAPPVLEPAAPHVPTIDELAAQAHAVAPPLAEVESTVDNARAAVDAALGASAIPAPEVPSFSTPDVPPTQPAFDTSLPPPPPMPDFSSLPPLPPLPGEPQVAPWTPPAEPLSPPPTTPLSSPQFPQQPPEPTSPNDPSQFKIPGQ